MDDGSENGLGTLVKMLHTKAGKAAAVAMAMERGITVDADLMMRHGNSGDTTHNSYPPQPFALLAAEYHEYMGFVKRSDGKTKKARKH